MQRTACPQRRDFWSLPRPDSLLLVFAAAFVLRILFCFLVVPAFGITAANGNDFFSSADGYTDLAYTLANHGKFAFTWSAEPTTFRGPPFPLALAAFYLLLENMDAATQLVNALASAASAVLAVLIAAAVLPGMSLLARYSVALLPLSIYYCASGFSDTFLTFTILLYVWTSVRLLNAPTAHNAVACGLALGLAALSKPIVLPFALLLPAYAWVRHWPAWKSAAGAAALALAVLSTWSLRNYALDGEFRLLSQGGGFNALVGNYILGDWSRGDVAFKSAVKRAIAEVERTTGAPVDHDSIRTAGHFDVEPETDERFAAAARAQFRADPTLLPRKFVINWVRFWYYSSSGPRSFLSALFNFPLLVVAALALRRCWRSEPLILGWLLVLIVTYVSLYALVIVNSTRYTLFPLILLTPFAAELLWRTGREPLPSGLWRRIQERLAPERRASTTPCIE